MKYAKNVITTYNTKLRPSSVTKKPLEKSILANKAVDKTCRYMTSSIDNIDKADLGLQVVAKKEAPHRPEKVIDISNNNNATKSFEINVKPLNDLIGLNNKSRNVRNNLINNKSSLFNSDKLLSQYSASYGGKNHMYSQIIAKSIHGVGINGTISNNKPIMKKANSNSKSRINSSVSKNKPKKVQVNLTHKLYGVTKSSQKSIKPEAKPADTRQDKPLLSEERETAKSNLSVFLNKNFNLLTNTQSKGNIIDLNALDVKGSIQIYNKIDSSKLKTKSNSITSNMSNGVNNSNNSRGKSALNKTRVTNVSYLKKNELSSYRGDMTRDGVTTLNSKNN
jgi:hypothetical protein